MVLADRIGVMRDGRIVQVGPPREVYEAPATRYVAGFVGEVNLFEAVVSSVKGQTATLAAAEAPGGFRIKADEAPAIGATVWLAVRPEKLRLTLDSPARKAANTLAGEISDISYTGDWTTFVIALPHGAVVRAAQANASRTVARPFSRGDRVWAGFDPDAAVVLTQ